MIEVREADGGDYAAVRTALAPGWSPATPPFPRELRLVAALDGAVVGAAHVRPPIHAAGGETALVWLGVLDGLRRRGVGTALEERAAAHARSLGKRRLMATVRDDNAHSLGFYAHRGYAEVNRMREVILELADHEPPAVDAPAGYELAPLRPEHDEGIWRVARESDADIPSVEPFDELPFEEWCTVNLRSGLLRELSFVALRDGRVAGFALLEEYGEGAANHAMTGVARSARGVGLATALKRAQIVASRRAGVQRLHTVNDFANAPMRRVNEKLGYVRRCDWIELLGPPIV